MYAGARMEFIDNWFPLIVTVREGSFDEAEMDQMASGWERYFRRAEPYAVLNTARLGANAPDARGRLRIAQWGNLPRVRQFSKLLCAGSATVMTFPGSGVLRRRSPGCGRRPHRYRRQHRQ